MRPGPGWQYVGCGVWLHTSGLRIHVGGVCQLPSGDVVYGGGFPESVAMYRYIRINGGNRKRGIMAWGLSKPKGGE